jgi:hypothetical protein
MRNVIPTEEPKGLGGGIYGGGSQLAPTQLHRSLHSLRSVGMTKDLPARTPMARAGAKDAKNN